MPGFKLEIYQPHHPASPKPQIPRHTHRFTLTSAVMGIFTIAPLPSAVSSNVISRTCRLLIFTLCKNHSSLLLFALTAIAGHLSMPALCWAVEPHRPCLLWSHKSPAQGLDSLHWMAWQTDDQTAVIFLKTPRVNMCQSQDFFFSWYIVALKCYARFSCGASMVTQRVKNLPAMQKTRVWSLVWEDPRRRK